MRAVADAHLSLRAPAWAFATLGILILFLIGGALCAFAVSGFSQLNPNIFMGLAFPAAIGAGLAAGAIGGRLRRYQSVTRLAAIVRCAVAFAAAAFAWTLSWGLADLDALGGAVDEILFGTLIAAICGALAGALASFAAMRAI